MSRGLGDVYKRQSIGFFAMKGNVRAVITTKKICSADEIAIFFIIKLSSLFRRLINFISLYKVLKLKLLL